MRDIFIFIILLSILFIAISAIFWIFLRYYRISSVAFTPTPRVVWGFTDDAVKRLITIKGISLSVDVADTPAKQAQGLSGRDSFGNNAGMLFIWRQPGRYPFWMKGMNFPIDIIWIGEDQRIAAITKNVEPNSFPRLFRPRSPAQYVLEVNAGWSDAHHLASGDMVGL